MGLYTLTSPVIHHTTMIQHSLKQWKGSNPLFWAPLIWQIPPLHGLLRHELNVRHASIRNKAGSTCTTLYSWSISHVSFLLLLCWLPVKMKTISTNSSFKPSFKPESAFVIWPASSGTIVNIHHLIESSQNKGWCGEDSAQQWLYNLLCISQTPLQIG